MLTLRQGIIKLNAHSHDQFGMWRMQANPSRMQNTHVILLDRACLGIDGTVSLLSVYKCYSLNGMSLCLS